MSSVVATCTMADGRPLAVLSDLIGKRVSLLREHTDDAVVATVIAALQSLRAATRVAKAGAAKGRAVVRAVGGVVPSMRRPGKGQKPRPCIRAGRSGPSVWNRGLYNGHRVVWAMARGAKVSTGRVFEVEGRGKGAGVVVVVAQSAASARRMADVSAMRRIARYGGMARAALSKAMHMASTRSPAPSAPSAKAAGVLGRSVRVTSRVAGGNFEVEARDALRYALHALRGGQAAVNAALMKAANKVASRIAHSLKARGLDGNVPTPFPEVARRR